MSVTIADPYAFDLTPTNLAAYGLDLLVPGEYVQYRFQARRSGAALSLANTTLVASVRRKESTEPSDLLFQRRSLDDIGGGWTPTTKQLAADADQAVENTTNDTGMGWWAMTFAPTDQAELLAAVGLWIYDVRALFIATGQVRTILRGRIQIPTPRTIVSQFTP